MNADTPLIVAGVGLLIAISAFNTAVSAWLGLTVLLNAERRTIGVWLAGLGMLCCSGFFVFHSAIIPEGLGNPSIIVPIAALLGWIPVIVLPFGWYIVLLWFVGFWEAPARRLQPHRILLPILSVFACVVLGLFLFNPSIDASTYARTDALIALFAQHSSFHVYSVYLFACLFAGLHVLRSLAHTPNTIGNIARARARPWLVAASALQIVVSAVVVVGTVAIGRSFIAEPLLALWILDAVVLMLIAAALVLVGEAVVRYEIFTGKVLPRQGLRRHWRLAILLAALLSPVFGYEVIRSADQFWLATALLLLATFMYALLNWRSYRGRERYLANLRPFIGSQGLYQEMVGAVEQSGNAALRPFEALCRNVLGARVAYLVPMGRATALAGDPVWFPQGTAQPIGWLDELTGSIGPALRIPGELAIALPRSELTGAVWGIPLWNDGGLIGILLLGEKLDGGLYTQEELEIARASGERLIDLMSATEMARRVVALQRDRLAESQIVDARTRRILHDDVLPSVHAAMLALSATGAADQPVTAPSERNPSVVMLGEIHRSISDLLRELPIPVTPNLEKMGLLGTLRSLVANEMRNAFDSVEWDVDPAAETELARLSPLVAEVVYYAVRETLRNAARYARPAATEPRHRQPFVVHIGIHADNELTVVVRDNGPGVPTNHTSTGGSGQGLMLHGTMLAVVGGSLTFNTRAGEGATVTVTAPRSSSIHPA